jgi:hypothetical protein
MSGPQHICAHTAANTVNVANTAARRSVPSSSATWYRSKFVMFVNGATPTYKMVLPALSNTISTQDDDDEEEEDEKVDGEELASLGRLDGPSGQDGFEYDTPQHRIPQQRLADWLCQGYWPSFAVYQEQPDQALSLADREFFKRIHGKPARSAQGHLPYLRPQQGVHSAQSINGRSLLS